MLDSLGTSGACVIICVSFPSRSVKKRVVVVLREDSSSGVRLAKSYRHVGGRFALVGCGRSGACVVVCSSSPFRSV